METFVGVLVGVYLLILVLGMAFAIFAPPR